MPDQETGQNSKAIALMYDGVKAPTVSAKGEGDLAEEIIAIAREHGVPLYENPELVHSLSQLDLGDEIPELLYRVIAEIIAFAYHIQGKVPEGFEKN
ncbi:flagellar biosynthesis protein FlhB [Hahella sp. CCB-MM4]|uniref:EscU/YscU/HrcU family type III secretion system export apparatus switch protein n=1 Tax=Hahella sp. (strain CCB-MM4) TaxID=1926491 RepID=UPI000B9B3FE4|nr:EscU/YscU/HrcU family type III secretion system export apparatus switch protein [Hahella sp. CCB-MM4]OZG71050.1 flagellar biosynthesis protein FlhB [Hahella sp. CCB-MM4]